LCAALFDRRTRTLPAEDFRCEHDDLKLVIDLVEQFLGTFGFVTMRHCGIVAQNLS